MNSKTFPILNPQRWDGAKPFLATCVRERRTGAFASLFLCLYICPLSVLCGMLRAMCPRQGNEGHIRSEDIATGALPAQQSCLPTLYLQPLCLCKQHFCTHLKAAAKLGLCVGLSVQSRSPQEKHRHLPYATLTSQSQNKWWNCGTWITYGVLFLYPAWAARQG